MKSMRDEVLISFIKKRSLDNTGSHLLLIDNEVPHA